MNLAHWLRRAACTHGDGPAIGRGDAIVLTYRQLARRASGAAKALRERCQLAPGDRVAIVASNEPGYIEVLFAAWWAGLVVVPINAKLHPNEIAWILDHSAARVVFTSCDLEPALAGLDVKGVERIVTFGYKEYEGFVACDPVDIVGRETSDLAWLFYTSGTTGRPKGAMLTHGNLAAMSLAHLIDVDPTSAGEGLLHCAPLSHGSGLLALPHVLAMGVNVLPESGAFDAAEVVSLTNHWRTTSFFAAPTMIKRLTRAPREIEPGALRTIVWGGAPMHVADTIDALDRLGPALAQIYGQGESPMTITALNKHDVADRDHPDWLHRLASAGTARSIVDVQVVDSDQRVLPTGETGEVIVRGATVMPGYWNDDAGSEAALRDGWLHTGDVGVLDDHGYLTLLDRSKDLVISGGANIYPREVEEVLMTHPRVFEVSVIGRPDPEWGEVVVAYVVGAATAEELDGHCIERIARFKRPKSYVFVEFLPKNNYGKVLKTEIRKWDSEKEEGR